MRMAAGGRCCFRRGAPAAVLVLPLLLLIAATALPRRALAATVAADGKCSALALRAWMLCSYVLH